MKKLKPLVFLALILFCLGCGRPGYTVRSGRVTYGQKDQKGYTRESDLPGADPSTFETLGERYGKDKQQVFRMAKPLAGCDPASFELLGDKTFFARDKSQVFAGWTAISQDPEHFEVLEMGWCRDSHRAYFLESALEGSDPASFEVIPKTPYAARDAHSVYWKSSRIDGADPKTFTILKGLYSKDGQTAYHEGKNLGRVDAQAFQTPSDPFAHDNKAVYYNGVVVEEADGSTSKFLDGIYFKDNAKVFCGNKPMPEADVATFETYRDGQYVYGKDKNHHYAGSKIKS